MAIFNSYVSLPEGRCILWAASMHTRHFQWIERIGLRENRNQKPVLFIPKFTLW